MWSGCAGASEWGWPLLKSLWWGKLKVPPLLRKVIGEQGGFRENSFDKPKDRKQLRTTEFCDFLKRKRDEGGHGRAL